MNIHPYRDQIRYTYRALLERTGDHTISPGQRVVVFADRCKFCVKLESIAARPAVRGRRDPGELAQWMDAARRALKGQPLYYNWSIYDGRSPDVVWEYEPALRDFGIPQPRSRNRVYQETWRFAGCAPTAASLVHLLSVAARRDGMAAVVKRYGLPASFARLIHPEVVPYDKPVKGLVTMAWMLGRAVALARSRGTGHIAGHPCKIFEVKDSPNASRERQILTRFWVEKRSGLVLKRETHALRGPLGSAGSRDFVVRELCFYDRLPASTFEVPVGAHVRVAALFQDVGVQLPKGVVAERDPTSGGYASCGVVFRSQSRPAPQRKP